MLGFSPLASAALADDAAGAIVDVTGVASTGDVGSVVVQATAVFSATGVQAATAIGVPTTAIGIDVVTIGVFGTSAVNSVSTTGSTIIIPLGVFADGVVGRALVWGRVTPDPGTTWTRIAA